MRPRDWMGLVIRSFGVWSGVQAMIQAGTLVTVMIRPIPADNYKPIDYVLGIVLYGVVALILLWSAEGISYMLYPDRNVEDDSI